MSEPYDPWRSPGGPGEPNAQPTQPPSYDPSGGQHPYGPPTGQPGMPGQYPYGSPYGQPAGPSQPYVPGQQGGSGVQGWGTHPYGQPAEPSQPMYPPYGQPAGPSQPMYGPYGQPAGPSQPWQGAPNSQTLPGAAPGWPQQPPTAPAPKKSRKKLWISLAVILALVVVACGGGALAFAQYIAPATTAGLFCGYMKTQNYTATYALLSSGLRGQLSQDQFTQGNQLLDKVEGTVQSCGQATGGNAYSYSLGASTAKVAATITRSTAGTLQGTVHLKSENGSWKVDAIDTSLLGVNLGALQTAGAFCAAMQTQSYTTAYGVLGSALKQQASQGQFTSQAHTHDQIDGTVSACGLVGISPGATDSSAALLVSITRTKLSQQQGTVGLDVEQGAWKIASVASNLLGTDLGPLTVGNQFCQALQNGQYQAAYNLLSHGFQANGSEADFAKAFTLPGPVKWAGCTPDLTTYKVTGTTASYTAAFKLVDTSNGASDSLTLKVAFVNESGSWKIDDLSKP